MVTYNIRNGLKQAFAPPGMGFWLLPGHPGYSMIYVRKRPMANLQLGHITGGDKHGSVKYEADEHGNIEVNIPAHMQALTRMGWPMVADGHTGTVEWDDLVFPDFLNVDDPHQRVLEDKSGRRVSPVDRGE